MLETCPTLALGCFAATTALAREGGEFASGRDEFLATCVSCYGDLGDGNGSIATMFKQPFKDLRRIAKRNDGAFPMLQRGAGVGIGAVFAVDTAVTCAGARDRCGRDASEAASGPLGS